MSIQTVKLPPYIPEPKKYHEDGECYCKRPLPSGRVYNAGTGIRWEACALCNKLPRRPK